MCEIGHHISLSPCPVCGDNIAQATGKPYYHHTEIQCVKVRICMAFPDIAWTGDFIARIEDMKNSFREYTFEEANLIYLNENMIEDLNKRITECANPKNPLHVKTVSQLDVRKSNRVIGLAIEIPADKYTLEEDKSLEEVQ